MKTLLIAAGLIFAGGLIFSACSAKKGDAVAQQDSTYTTVAHPEWSRNAVIYEVNLRQYTDSGSITEFAKQLPRLKELGVDILWFMPIHLFQS
jgi:1,4-alpha-glucan branching enzyme